jgi:hypothetical protein
LRALHIAQFSSQYLLSSKKLLDEKKKVIKKALHVFNEEESILDLKLAKYRARKKAMIREMEEMDRVTESYKRTLIALKPKLKDKKLKEFLKGSGSEDEGSESQSEDETDRRRKKREKIKHEKKSRKNVSSKQLDEEEHDEAVISRLPARQRSQRRHEEVEDVFRPDISNTPASNNWKPARVASKKSHDRDLPLTTATKRKTSRDHDSPKSRSRSPEKETVNEKEEDKDDDHQTGRKVKSFSSFKPISVNRKTLEKLQEEVNEEEVELVKTNVKSISTKTTTIEPKRSLAPSPVLESRRSILNLEDMEDQKKQKMDKNAELLMDFAKKRKEAVAASVDYNDKSLTFRSSMGGDSTAFSIDSLNATGELMNRDNDDYYKPSSRPPSARQSSTPTVQFLKDSKTWTPTGSSPSDQHSTMASYDDSNHPSNKLSNTFPPSIAIQQTMEKNRLTAQQDDSVDDPSLLMESFESEMNNISAAGSKQRKTRTTDQIEEVKLSIDINKSMFNDMMDREEPAFEDEKPASFEDQLSVNDSPLDAEAKHYQNRNLSKKPSYSSEKPSSKQSTQFQSPDEVKEENYFAESKEMIRPPLKSPYSRPSPLMNTDSGGFDENEDSFNSSTQRSSPFNNTGTMYFNRKHHMADSQDSNEEGSTSDLVLLGTSKYPSEKPNFALTDSSKGSNLEKDDEGDGGGYSDDSFVERDENSFNDTQSTLRSPDEQLSSPVHSTPQQQRQKRFSHPPNPLHLSSEMSHSGMMNQSTELSPVFEGLKDTSSHFGDLSYSSLQPVKGEPEHHHQQQSSALKWEIGRAPIDLLELAIAFEVDISAVRLNSNVSRIVKEFYVKVEFLDVESPMSHTVVIRSDSIVQPLSFYACKYLFCFFLY